MPKRWREYLFRNDLKTHFARALGVGLVLRLCAAFFIYGPQALDDYKHGVWPAYQIFAGQPLDLPGYRSPLLDWVLAAPLWPAAALGFTSARAQVRVMYLVLAVISLLALWGTYLFARRQRSRLWGPLALYLVAAHPLMPFVGTRAFGEAVAGAFVGLSFGLLPAAPFAGFAALGAATLFRFHVGVMFTVALAWCAVRREWRAVARGVAAGVVTLGAEVVVDLAAGRGPLETLLTYLRENEGGGARYGVSPWYNPVLFVLVVGLAPFSLPLLVRAPALWRRHARTLGPWLAFVAAHAFVAHKEERFLYPVLTLELWALAYLWAAGARSKWALRVFTPVALVVTTLGLAIGCFVNTQAGEIEPPAEVESRFRDVLYLDHESLFAQSRVRFYFLRAPSTLEVATPDDFTAIRVDDALAAREQREAVALLTSNADAAERLRPLAGVTTQRARCGELRTAQSFVDRVLYGLNPRHNQRRRPTWYLVCERMPRADH